MRLISLGKSNSRYDHFPADGRLSVAVLKIAKANKEAAIAISQIYLRSSEEILVNGMSYTTPPPRGKPLACDIEF